MPKKVTSFDVARLAGVSQPTVSRALRNLPGTSPATQSKVRAAAAELAYVVNDSARGLSTTRTRRIAVVAEELTNPYYPELVEPLRRCLSEHDLRTVLVTPADHTDVTLSSLVDGAYDGVILTTTLRHSHLPRDLTERGIPHVLVHRVLDHAESHSCSVDNVGGTHAVAQLLAGLGHTEVATIQGPVETSTGRERGDTLRTALRGHGISLRRGRTVRGKFSHEAGHQAATALLGRPDRPTAIVCGNDVIAMGALSAASQLGLEVPTDVTVIGFDDIAMAGWPFIGLTTVHCDLDRLARTAVDLLVEEIAEPHAKPRLERIEVNLVLRSTHGPPSR